MSTRAFRRRAAATAFLVGVAALPTLAAVPATPAGAAPLDPMMVFAGRYNPVNPLGGSEIVAYGDSRMYVTNGVTNSLDVIDISDVTAPTLVTSTSLAAYGLGVQSVDVSGSLVAVAVSGNPAPQDPGRIAFFDLDGVPVADVAVGALPDMVTFSPDGTKAFVANEGEPATYCAAAPGELNRDPRGSISVIDVTGTIEQADVTDVGFTAFDGTEVALRSEGIRIYGPAASVSQDLEPEYIAVSSDSSTLHVTLQENNALAIVDVATATVTDLVPLGYKDWNAVGNTIDVSDRDGAGNTASINLQNRPVNGMYQPDGIASFDSGGNQYLATANEGDSREYGCLLGGAGVQAEDERAGSIGLDPTVFAGQTGNTGLGRLNVTRLFPSTYNGSNQLTEAYTLGARSFSIWDAAGNQVFDSGDDIEQITSAQFPTRFNSDWNTTTGNVNGFDTRSDNKGPEPESVTTGTIGGTPYLFVALERIGGVMMYDVTDPAAPVFLQYLNTANVAGNLLNGTAGDVSPEGLHFVDAAEAPDGVPLLLVANEVSGTTAVIEITTNGTIAGTVTAEGSNAPIGGATVRIYDGTNPIATTKTTGTGYYQVRNLSGSGTYRIRFTDKSGAFLSEYNGNVTSFNAAPPIAVGPGAIAVTDAALAPAATTAISGTVTADLGGTALAGITVIAYQDDVLVKGTITDSAGNFRLAGLSSSGSWKLRFRDATDVYGGEYWNGATGLATATSFTLTTGTTTVRDAGMRLR